MSLADLIDRKLRERRERKERAENTQRFVDALRAVQAAGGSVEIAKGRFGDTLVMCHEVPDAQRTELVALGFRPTRPPAEEDKCTSLWWRSPREYELEDSRPKSSRRFPP